MKGARAVRGCALVGLVSAALLGAAAPARADNSSCSYNAFFATVVVQIIDTGFNDPQGVAVFNGQIRHFNDGLLSPCGGANVNNTELVVIRDDSASDAAGVTAVIYPYTGPFAPGLIGEAGGSDEIEFEVDLHGGPDDLLIDNDVDGTHPRPANIRMGRSGADRRVNLNANESDGIDSDVTLNGVDEVFASGASPNDIRASGGRGTGDAPLDLPTRLWGEDGKDRLAGGSVGDQILGFEGVDRLFGGRGRDSIKAFEGPDRLFGQDGRDRLFGGLGRDRLNGGRRRDRCADSRRGTLFSRCEHLIFKVIFP